MDFQDILYEVDGPIGVITLNRPKYRNAQSYRMLDEIDAAFATLVRLQAGGLVVAPDGLFISRREQIVTLASRRAVPARMSGP